jgi:glutamate-1-semialdehyde 2,1-aminomutase
VNRFTLPDKSELIFRRAAQVMPCGVSSPVRFYSPYPFFVRSGFGSKIVTVDYNTYTDYCMGYGALLLGHAYPPLMDYIKAELDKGTLFCIPTENEVNLAEILSKVVPVAEMTRILNTGMEATMTAIRLARAYTKRKKIIKLDGCYHGAHDYGLVRPSNNGYEGIPASDGTPEAIASQTLITDYNDISKLEDLIRNGEDIAAVIVEPVAANMGLVIPEKQYLNEIRRITEQNGIILIFDEVVTGFRLSLGGASEFFGIKPDIVTLAKAMGNGFPIAAICGKKAIMELLSPKGNVYQASTYGGNPISVAAALKTIETLIDIGNEVYPRITRACESLVVGIRDLAMDLGFKFAINSIGSMYQLFFTTEQVNNYNSAKKCDKINFRRLYDQLLKRDIFIPPSQFETCFVSNAHTEEDIDKTVEAYGQALKEVRNHCG